MVRNMSKAIVTLVVGQKYRDLWHSIARPSWEHYASRHGYQLIVFERLFDESRTGLQRSPSWQKLLTLRHAGLQQFDQVLWLDSDIIINPQAPCAVSQVPLEKVGAVTDQALLSHPSLATAFARNNGWGAGPAALSRQFYASNSLPAPAGYHLNGGVWVASPGRHGELFEYIYRTHQERPHSYFEQAAFSSEVIGRGLHHFLDPRFNALWLEYRVAFYPFLSQVQAMHPLCIAIALRNAFFLHFAVLAEDMKWFDPRVVADFDTIALPSDLSAKIEIGWRPPSVNPS